MNPITRRLLAALVAIGATFAYGQLVVPAAVAGADPGGVPAEMVAAVR